MSIEAPTRIPALYNHPSLRPRRKGERYDQSLSRKFWYIGDDSKTVHETNLTPGVTDPVIGTAVHVGECTHSNSGGWLWADCYEVTLPGGRVVPCTRLRMAAADQNYVLCHNFSWVMGRK